MKLFPSLISKPLVSLFAFSALLFSFSSLFFTGCGGGGVKDGMVSIEGSLRSCSADSVFLLDLVGSETVRIAAAPLTKDGANSIFKLKAKIDMPGVYLLGTGPRSAARVVLGNEGKIGFSASCDNIANDFKVAQSPENDTYKAFLARNAKLSQTINQLSQNLQMFQMTNPAAVPQLQSDLQRAHDSKQALADSLIAKGGMMAKVAQLSSYKRFGSDPAHSSYNSELAYFSETFFQNIDLSDPSLSRLPQLADRATGYAQTLGQAAKETCLDNLHKVLAAAPVGNPNRQILYIGFLSGLQQVRHDGFMTLGEEFLSEYPANNGFTAQIQSEINKMKSTAVGSIPPGLSLPTHDGKEFSLDQVKGKYVLLDFWASWCRPCRQENPNVIKVYEKYRAKGFEIVGVSLDKEKEKWLTAIEQDGLKWLHISDLQAWQSRAAADYGVTSIPMTFLLDPEGKIIGKGLRGPALESKLVEIFGS